MKRLKGIAASRGYAVGSSFCLADKQQLIEKKTIDDTEKEAARFEQARIRAGEVLQGLYEDALEKVGEEQAQIFQVHKLLLEDEEFIEAVRERITGERLEACYAVQETGAELEEMFRMMDNEYMNERAADIRDIADRLIRILSGREEVKIDGSGILLAIDLTPSETIHIDKSKVLAFVTKEGSAISHSAILARTIGIPAVTGVAELAVEELEGTVIVDGFRGEVYLDPDAETLRIYQERKEAYEKETELLKQYRGQPSRTKDGQEIELNCNIGGVDDVAAVQSQDGEGIGLFRSEFLYMQGSDFPREEEQFEAYKTVLEKMAPGRVIVRTLDLGADKHVPYFQLESEENPAMGYRAIRICLEQKEIFRTQVRALLRASVYGRLGIMFPMIVSLEEVRQVKEFVNQTKAEMTAEGIPIADKIELGVMIETPAAAIASDLLAAEVDFFSIGTNDLTQYTLAVDRMNSKVARIYDPRNTSVLRLIKMTADNAHKEGKWVGICGESAADEELLGFYLAAGIDELSVSPNAVLRLRKEMAALEIEKVRETELEKWLTLKST